MDPGYSGVWGFSSLIKAFWLPEELVSSTAVEERLEKSVVGFTGVLHCFLCVWAVLFFYSIVSNTQLLGFGEVEEEGG